MNIHDLVSIRWAIKQGANINSKNLSGKSCIEIALKYDKSGEVIKLLIENGATYDHVSDEDKQKIEKII
jgi:ankyrin repeat protein